MNEIKTTPHVVIAVCTERWSKLWVDGNAIPTATAFELTCGANDYPLFKLEADVRSIAVHDDFVMDADSAKAVLACISTQDLVEMLQAYGYSVTKIAERRRRGCR